MRKYLVLLLVAAVAFCAVPAMAQAPAAPASEKTVDVYAQIWWNTFYEKDDKWVKGGNPYRDMSQDQAYYNKKSTGYETQDFSFGLDPIVTRLGANFKKDNLTGKFEIRPFGDGGNANLPGVPKWSSLLREAWAQYEFKDLAGIKVLIGQTYCPLYMPIYMMAQGGMNTWAGAFRPEDRTPMVQVQLPLGPEKSSLKVAAIRPNQGKVAASTDVRAKDATTTTPAYAASTYFDYYENPFPKFEAAYNLRMTAGPANLNICAGAGYQQVKAIHQASTAEQPYAKDDITVNSYFAGGAATVIVGPFEVRASYQMAQNGKEYSDGDVLAAAYYNVTTKTLYNSKSWGAHGVLAYKIDIFQFYVSRGMNYGEIDIETKKTEQDAFWTSAGVIIKVSPSLIIQPEYAVKDGGTTKVTGSGAGETNCGTQRYVGFVTIISL